jgi:hypothetical protein
VSYGPTAFLQSPETHAKVQFPRSLCSIVYRTLNTTQFGKWAIDFLESTDCHTMSLIDCRQSLAAISGIQLINGRIQESPATETWFAVTDSAKADVEASIQNFNPKLVRIVS